MSGGTDIRTIQQLLGHADLGTTMIYTHLVNEAGSGTRSPLDDLGDAEDVVDRDEPGE